MYSSTMEASVDELSDLGNGIEAAGVVIHSGKQGKHQKDHPNYMPGKSVLTHPDPQGLLDEFGGTGTPVTGVKGQAGYKERVDFGQVIGDYVDPTTGVATQTTKGIITYDSNGMAHIIPARP